MWKQFFDALTNLLNLLQRVEKQEKEIKKLRQENKELMAVAQRLVWEQQRQRELVEIEQRLLKLELENQLLRISHGLAPAELESPAELKNGEIEKAKNRADSDKTDCLRSRAASKFQDNISRALA